MQQPAQEHSEEAKGQATDHVLPTNILTQLKCVTISSRGHYTTSGKNVNNVISVTVLGQNIAPPREGRYVLVASERSACVSPHSLSAAARCFTVCELFQGCFTQHAASCLCDLISSDRNYLSTQRARAHTHTPISQSPPLLSPQQWWCCLLPTVSALARRQQRAAAPQDAVKT